MYNTKQDLKIFLKREGNNFFFTMYRWCKCYKEWSWNLHEVVKAIPVSCDTKLFPILVIGISGLFNILGRYGRFQWQVMSILGFIHGLFNRWTAMSPFLFLTSGQHEVGNWDSNYTPGVNFWTMIFYNLKNSRQDLFNEGSNFILSSVEVGHWVA